MISQRWHNWIPWVGFILALSLRLWHLGLPGQIVSDEVSFVNDGRSYLAHQQYFDPHPPLGKLQIGLSIKAFGDRPFAWRLPGALEGALIIPLLWWIAWRLTKNRLAAALAVFFGLLDGLMLVDSRLGMINIPYVLFSLVAFAAVLKTLESERAQWWIFVAGLFLGLGIATKWLAILVGLPSIILWVWPEFFGQARHSRSPKDWTVAGITLIILPALIYRIIFYFHYAWLGIGQAFVATNVEMLKYHLSVPPTGDPNHQPWWGWLLAWRPFPYWSDDGAGQVRFIRSLPNPLVWWSSAIIFLSSLIRGWRDGMGKLINMLLLFAWLPFLFIQRVMYSYHMMLMDVWLIILISIFISRMAEKHRKAVATFLIASATVFLWFLPWYLNIPLSKNQQRLREWLPSWHFSQTATPVL